MISKSVVSYCGLFFEIPCYIMNIWYIKAVSYKCIFIVSVYEICLDIWNSRKFHPDLCHMKSADTILLLDIPVSQVDLLLW